MSPYGDLAQRKTDYWRTNKGKNLKKIVNPLEIQPLEAKCVGNWKSEILCWAHYLVRNKKIVKFCVYRPCSLDVRRAYASHAPPTPRPARPPPNTWLRHATETHLAHLWEIDRLVDGLGEGESPAHAPRFSYRLVIHGTVWGLGLTVSSEWDTQFSWRISAKNISASNGWTWL